MLRGISRVVALATLVAAALASVSAGQGPPGGSPPGLDRALAAKQKHANRLLDKPGVAGVAVALNPAGKPVIEIYKERADVADLPHDLDGVPVETTTTGVIQPFDHAPTHRYPRPVPIGVSTGLSGVATGTIGARVTDGTNVYALSNNHVFAGVNTASIGDPIISPGDADGGSDPADRIGTLHAYQTIDFGGGINTMDAAIALTSVANVGIATPADGYGPPSPTTATATLGLPVAKYGRTTGFQLGSVAGTNISVDVCYIAIGEFCLQEARFAGQVSVSPGTFAAPGDSGSLIVTQGGNQPVALLFAGGDGLTIGTPIDLVLQRFGVTIDGAQAEGPPAAPTGLAAYSGDTSATLTWNAPTFDGGSPVLGYRIYRGIPPAAETFLQSVGNVTSFTDSGLVNGTTYSYRVSADNANGEGQLSSAATATPTDIVAPAEPLPTTDGFDRANENPLSDAGRWSNGVIGSVETGHFTTGGALACSKTTTCTAWRNTTQYGPDTEVWARVSTLAGDNNHIRLYARLQQVGSSAYDGYMLRTNQLPGTDQIYLERVDNSAFVNRLTISRELATGDVLLLRVLGSTLEVWRNDGSAWARLGVVTDATYGAAGFAGIGLRGTTGRLDDFGARAYGDVPPVPTAPSSPQGLAATASDGLVRLSWQPPADNGGSPVTGYRVFRGTSAGNGALLQAIGPVTTFDDTAVTNETTYYYTVTAENAVGEGPPSAEVSARPSNLVLPVEPLPTVDAFNRPNERPLSDAGRWGDGINGAGERSLRVASNQLASDRTTTATAWRKDRLYGPDVETWVTVHTLPGNGNWLRLYARLQEPGSSAHDGYMLVVTQASGVDQWVLQRVTNYTWTTLASGSQEVAAGNRVLLRAVGTTLEAWIRSGTSWTRVLRVSDTAYTGAGYVGVGLRAKTGRLDDFGAR